MLYGGHTLLKTVNMAKYGQIPTLVKTIPTLVNKIPTLVNKIVLHLL